MTNLQFGKYHGKNFLWLLENDLGWATMLMADHGKLRETSKRAGDPQWDNKDALFRYVQHFPVMKSAINARQESNVSKRTVGESEKDTLIGFGPYKDMSRFNLYHSMQDEHKRYVKSILQCKVTYPGGQLDKLKQYIERQNQEHVLEDALLVQAAEQAEQSGLQEQPPSTSVETCTSRLSQPSTSSLEKVR